MATVRTTAHVTRRDGIGIVRGPEGADRAGDDPEERRHEREGTRQPQVPLHPPATGRKREPVSIEARRDLDRDQRSDESVEGVGELVVKRHEPARRVWAASRQETRRSRPRRSRIRRIHDAGHGAAAREQRRAEERRAEPGQETAPATPMDNGRRRSARRRGSRRGFLTPFRECPRARRRSRPRRRFPSAPGRGKARRRASRADNSRRHASRPGAPGRPAPCRGSPCGGIPIAWPRSRSGRSPRESRTLPSRRRPPESKPDEGSRERPETGDDAPARQRPPEPR